jgi:hypothetical protein
MLISKVPDVQQSIIRNFQASPPVDVIGLARALGVNVFVSSKLNEASGKLFRDTVNGGANGYSILVNVSDPVVRQRFTVAHELGHYLLHLDNMESGEITDDAFYRSGLGVFREAEANRVAAEILMPLDRIQMDRAILSGNGQNPDDAKILASQYGVSEMAMAIRVDQLLKGQYVST